MSDGDRTARWAERFAASAGQLPGARLPWLAARRREAWDAFAARGFPGRRDEAWRFTNVAPLAETAFEPSTRLALALRAPVRGARVTPLDEALETEPERLEPWLGGLADVKQSPFTALNTALFRQGFLVEIEPGAALAAPLELVLDHAAGPAALEAQPRILVRAGAGSRAVLVERWQGQGLYWNNAVTEVVLEGDARLHHVRVQREAAHAFHVANVAARVQGPGHFASHSLALGAAIARVDLQVELGAEGAQCELDGLYLGREHQLIDHHTAVDHARPHTTSRELYKGILDGHARGVFCGRVHVRPDAQRIEASQTNRNLLLADDAAVHTQPQLEIYADDVKCAHGASIGRLDENALFYLRSRGIGRAEARALLTLAFAREVLERLPHAALQDELEGILGAWLAGRPAAAKGEA